MRAFKTILAAVLLLAFVPIFTMIILSLKTNVQIYGDFFTLPHPVAWENYSMAVDRLIPNMVNTLIDAGHVVITVGGGGIPVIEKDGRLVGVPAVIDKDFASAKLAELVHADALVILTAVDRVAINWGKPDQKSLERMTCAEAEQYCREGHFAPGSMLPKVQAAMSFARTGGEAIIASLENAAAALRGESGTKVIQ